MTVKRKKAIAAAMKITTGYGGLCLKFVRTVYGIGPKYASALEAWSHAHRKHPTSSTKKIPKGAPIFFAPHGSPYGHVALYLGDGKMRTTNSATGRVATNQVSSWLAAGYPLLGWTEDLNGQKLPGLWVKRYQRYHTSKPTRGHKKKTCYYDRPRTGRKHITRKRRQCHNLKVDTNYTHKRWARTKRGDYIKLAKITKGKAGK